MERTASFTVLLDVQGEIVPPQCTCGPDVPPCHCCSDLWAPELRGQQTAKVSSCPLTQAEVCLAGTGTCAADAERTQDATGAAGTCCLGWQARKTRALGKTRVQSIHVGLNSAAAGLVCPSWGGLVASR